MKRRHITEEQLLAEITANAGPHAGRVAARLLDFAESVDGAYKVGRHKSISVRYRRLDRSEEQWLTLFVITTVGTFYCNWLYRWHEQGFPKSVEKQYELDLKHALNRAVIYGPVEPRDAVPLKEVQRKWTAVSRTVSSTVDRLRLLDKPLPATSSVADVSAIEGLATEGKITRYGRNRSLREAKMREANGICVVCRHDFKQVLEGRGRCVLQVHHLKQLSVRDRPKRTRPKDLVVVCANCHMMLHFADRGRRPLLPSDLRARLRTSV